MEGWLPSALTQSPGQSQAAGQMMLWFPPTHPSLPLYTHSSPAPGPGPGRWVSHSHIPASIAHVSETPRLGLAAHGLRPRAPSWG